MIFFRIMNNLFYNALRVIGLKNIQERAKSIDSEIEIKSIINEGTTIKLKVKNTHS